MLEPFEITPAAQPDENDPVVFTVKPLDQRGYINMTAIQGAGITNADKMAEIASRYVVGWKGGGQPPCIARDEVRRRLHEACNGPPNVLWLSWLVQIASELVTRATPKDDDAKKF